jgi:hypothetical protein
LVVGHPGHELRVHRWLELATPIVFVLTDGSGRAAGSRMPSTTRVLTNAGARPSDVYGRFTDAEVYEALRTGDVGPFVEVLLALADAFQERNIDYVAADAIEGFNPSHDLCRYIVNGATALARHRSGRAIANFDFLLEADPTSVDARVPDVIQIDLDEAALARKLAAAYAYPELRAETQSAIGRFGSAAFATEILRPVVDLRQGLDEFLSEAPLYELFGEHQVRMGLYESVIRFGAHVRPFVLRLWLQAGVPGAAAVDTIASPATGGSI